LALSEDDFEMRRHADDALWLQQISSSLISEGNIDAFYNRLLDAAISLMSADMGSMQVFNRESGELRLLAERDFILSQLRTGNGYVSMRRVPAAWRCPRGVG
jgi:hypothetical protein